jgi:hypothetical protein
MPAATSRIAPVLAILSSGCASHGEIHIAPDESKPHISWELRAGKNEGDEEFICGSAQPSKECELIASSDEDPRLAALHLLGHAAAQPTSYLGFMRASFLEGAAERKVAEINVTIEPGSRPTGPTVIGRVTSKAGTYTLAISVDATQPQTPAPQHISQEATVVVK